MNWTELNWTERLAKVWNLGNSKLQTHNCKLRFAVCLMLKVSINLPFTASWPTAYACPKMFIAEHLYTPASLPFKFCKRKVSPKTNDSLIFVWLFNLLQTTVGLGLPITEHLNVADPVSFIVDLAGETTTEGAEIDSPGSPLDPGMPAGPMSPFCPFGPVTPGGPIGPMMPCLPLFPGDPIIPWSPLFPCFPLCPLRPRVPFSPLGPGGPGGPSEHVTPFDWQMCGFNSNISLFILSVVFTESTWRLFLWSSRDWSSKKNRNTLYCHVQPSW